MATRPVVHSHQLDLRVMRRCLTPRACGEALYEYDFGDGWEHTVVLEAVVNRVSRKRYPVCVAGTKACPPEDCGGVSGYENLLEILQDPDDEEYEETLEWLGGKFEPEVFSPKKVKFDNPKKRFHIAFSED